MAKIYFDGTDQYILFRASAINESGVVTGPFTGSAEGEALPGAILVVSEYKKDDEVVESPVVIWNATIGKWKATIPTANITQYGPGEVTISGTGMVTASVEFEAIAATDYNENIVEGTFSRTEIERMVAAVLLGNETRTPGSSVFTGIDGSTARGIVSYSSAGRTWSSRDGE